MYLKIQPRMFSAFSILPMWNESGIGHGGWKNVSIERKTFRHSQTRSKGNSAPRISINSHPRLFSIGHTHLDLGAGCICSCHIRGSRNAFDTVAGIWQVNEEEEEEEKGFSLLEKDWKENRPCVYVWSTQKTWNGFYPAASNLHVLTATASKRTKWVFFSTSCLNVSSRCDNNKGEI